MDALRRWTASMGICISKANKEMTEEGMHNLEDMTFGDICAFFACMLKDLPEEYLNTPVLDVLESMSEEEDYLDKLIKIIEQNSENDE